MTRIWFSGPRIFGLRPGVSFPVGGGRDPRGTQKSPGGPIGGSFVYVVRGDHNVTKIGVTTNPRARLAQLRTGSPFPIDYAFLGATPGAGYDIEQAAHALLGHKRVNGEWFDVSPEVAIAAVMGAAGKLGQPVEVTSLEAVDRTLGVAAAGGQEPSAGAETPSGLFVMAFLAVVITSMAYGMIKVGADPGPAVLGSLGAFAVMSWIMLAVSRVLGR